MNVSLTNEVMLARGLHYFRCCSDFAAGETQGPVTFTLDSRKFEYVTPSIPVAESSGTRRPAKSTNEASKSRTLGTSPDADPSE